MESPEEDVWKLRLERGSHSQYGTAQTNTVTVQVIVTGTFGVEY